MTSLRKRLLKFAPAVLVVAIMLGDSAPAAAATCFTDLAICYLGAAKESNWIWMWLAGLDCELTFAGCVNSAIFK